MSPLVKLTRRQIKRILRDLERPYLYDKEALKEYRELVRALLTEQRTLEENP